MQKNIFLVASICILALYLISGSSLANNAIPTDADCVNDAAVLSNKLNTLNTSKGEYLPCNNGMGGTVELVSITTNEEPAYLSQDYRGYECVVNICGNYIDSYYYDDCTWTPGKPLTTVTCEDEADE